MGRKKKTVVEAKTTNAIGYEGNIKISVQKGKRIISSKEYKNTGCPLLFKFLSYAFKGELVETLRPNRIVLFDKSATESADDTTPEFTKDLKISLAVLNDTTPVITEVSANDTNNLDNYWTTTLHFRVPYTYIEKNNIYKIALVNSSFDDELTTAEANICAYHRFVKTDNSDWEPITIDSTKKGNYSLIIEWTLAIKNITK